MRRNQMDDKVTITCYGKTRTMTRKDAIQFYMEGMCECDGSERERYTSIYCQLVSGQKVCSDR